MSAIRHYPYLLFSLLIAVPAGAQLVMQTPAQDEEGAKCMGIDIEDYRAAFNPTHGEPRMLTKDESDKGREAKKKINKVVPQKKQMDCQNALSRETTDAMMGKMQQAMDATEQKMANAHGMTEAPGKTAVLSADPAADLAGGKTVVRDIDWNAGDGTVSEAGGASFRQAMTALAPALTAAGGRFHVDFYLDPRYGAADANRVAEQRLKTLRDALGSGVQIEKGKVDRNRDTRIEFVKM